MSFYCLTNGLNVIHQIVHRFWRQILFWVYLLSFKIDSIWWEFWEIYVFILYFNNRWRGNKSNKLRWLVIMSRFYSVVFVVSLPCYVTTCYIIFFYEHFYVFFFVCFLEFECTSWLLFIVIYSKVHLCKMIPKDDIIKISKEECIQYTY